MTLLYLCFFKYLEALARHIENTGEPDTPLDERLIAILSRQVRWRPAPRSHAKVGYHRQAMHHWHRSVSTGTRP
jgi:hypothetical protein